jgi:hypothetical protein
MTRTSHPRYDGRANMEHAMKFPRCAMLALGIVLVVPAGAAAERADKPLSDFTPFVPPVFPLPPASKVTPGGVGAPQQSPYTTAPLQDPPPSYRDRQPAPGLKLTIPTR